MNDNELALAERAQMDAKEMAAIVAHAIATRSARDGLSVNLAYGIEPLLGAAWELAKYATPDREEAKRLYAGLLRRFADGLEGDGDSTSL